MEQKVDNFIFNHNKMLEIKHLKDRLNTINRAFRGNKDNQIQMWVNEAGKECYLLDTDGSHDGHPVPISLSFVRTLDLLKQTACPHKFKTATLEMNYAYVALEGEEKQKWIQDELRAYPYCSEEDIRYTEVYKSVLESCVIYQGKAKSMEYRYSHDMETSQIRRSLSAGGVLYIEMLHERAFEPFKDIFYRQVLTKEDKSLLQNMSGNSVAKSNAHILPEGKVNTR